MHIVSSMNKWPVFGPARVPFKIILNATSEKDSGILYDLPAISGVWTLNNLHASSSANQYTTETWSIIEPVIATCKLSVKFLNCILHTMVCAYLEDFIKKSSIQHLNCFRLQNVLLVVIYFWAKSAWAPSRVPYKIILNATAENAVALPMTFQPSVGFEPWTTCVQASALTISTTETWLNVATVICCL